MQFTQVAKISPRISVVVPVFNDAGGIQVTLLALYRQSYPKDRFEIIVIDNHSTDQTPAMIKKTANCFNGNIITAKEPVRSSYAARNKGIRLSKGKYLAFIDANMWVPDNWLEKGVACLEQGKGDYIGCQIQVMPASRNLSICEKYHMAMGFPVKDYMKNDGYAPTACLFVSRKVIDHCGGFNQDLFSGGDVEFGTRVRDAGFSLYYDEVNVMYHPAITSLRALIKKQKRVTSGQIILRRKYPSRFAHNRLKDILICYIQILPVVSPWVLKRIQHPGTEFLQKLFIFYMLRLYTCWQKFIHRCCF